MRPAVVAPSPSARRRLAALRIVGAALGHHATPPGRTDWAAVAAVADDNGLTPALWLAWRDHDDHLPVWFRRHLTTSYESNLGRTIVIRHQIAAVTEQLAASRVDSMLLKGAAYLAADAVGDLGGRLMADIDVLIRADDLDEAATALETMGYVRRPLPYGRVHHDVFFESPDHPAPVEIHIAVGPPEIADILPTAEMLESAEARDLRGTRVLVPSPEDALVHHLLHAQVQDRNHAFFGVPLRQLHTSVLLDRAWRGTVDEGAVGRRLESAGHGAALAGHVDLVHRIFGHSMLRGHRRHRSSGIHSRISLVSFALGWPTDVARNLRWTVRSEYLHARYGRPRTAIGRAVLPARHLLITLARSGSGVLTDARAARR